MSEGELVPGVIYEQHLIALMLYLLKNGETYSSKLKPVSGNYYKIVALAVKLGELGLVEVTKEEKPRLAMRFKLTPKGKKVAEKLREAKELIGG